MGKDLNPSERQYLSQLLSNSIIQEHVYNALEDMHKHAYRSLVGARGSEDLFRAQGKMAMLDEITGLFKKLKEGK
jgi:hypothetical protein